VTASNSDCIFCKIANGEVEVPFVHESENAVAFDDLEPLANDHILVVPRRHVASVGDLTRDDDSLLGDLIETVREVVKLRGLEDSGYRVVTNTGPDAGQSVFHLHLHVLGGEKLGRFGAPRS
jgi:histidine triad (HIT) family protein